MNKYFKLLKMVMVIIGIVVFGFGCILIKNLGVWETTESTGLYKGTFYYGASIPDGSEMIAELPKGTRLETPGGGLSCSHDTYTSKYMCKVTVISTGIKGWVLHDKIRCIFCL